MTKHGHYEVILDVIEAVLGTVVLGCFPGVEVVHHSHSLAWPSCAGKSVRRAGV